MPDTQPRNLVYCCDGTANQYGTVNTNIVHLYQRLAGDPATRIARYEPGVGTFSPLGLTDGGRIGITLGNRLREIEPRARIHTAIAQRIRQTAYNPAVLPGRFQ